MNRSHRYEDYNNYWNDTKPYLKPIHNVIIPAKPAVRPMYMIQMMGYNRWYNSYGECLFWKDMDGAYLMNCVKLTFRYYRNNFSKMQQATDMWRYCAWREKGHA